MTRPDFSAARWRKSSHSSGQGGECIEMADLAPLVAVRDSKHPDGTKLTFSRRAWTVFASQIKDGL